MTNQLVCRLFSRFTVSFLEVTPQEANRPTQPFAAGSYGATLLPGLSELLNGAGVWSR